MTNFIPIFPLNIVAYPGELLNLHIFEERYKELVNDCFAEGKPFGIPTVLANGMAELGTLVKITEIVEVYANGKIDIRTEGQEVFRILEVVKSVPEKKYSGAIVNYPVNDHQSNRILTAKVLVSIRQLHKLLNVTKDFKKKDEELTSYDLAHHAGLSIEEEYALLGLFYELQRLEYLKRHLQKVLPVMTGMENLKEKILLNGHFKELKGFNLDR